MDISTTIFVLLAVALLTYAIVPLIKTHRQLGKLERLRNCSDEELPEAIQLYLQVYGAAQLAALSVHFGRPMDQIRKILQNLEGVMLQPESSERVKEVVQKDPGFEIWTIA